MAAVGIEVFHCFNALWVKNRWDNWELHSEIDSCILHTLAGANIARYFRRFSWFDFALFAVLRCAVEHLSEDHGGLIEVKAITERQREGNLGDCLRLGLVYGFWYAASICVLGRSKLLHPVFLALLLVGYPLTLVQSYHYLLNKSSTSFWLAHAANLISTNPPVVAAGMRFLGLLAA
ncbi:hypothetical protein AK812_SmicGene23612 [Symbiodinium microadriaticum]|uniref:Uncharacterized protein n=2 Tax=Symbiodinium microadriaticum TaxID=2951 RepID=A0A1Q9DGU5_SYMMI|nr:hypothetical protein AK812_SmicGene23612 [Symbiodinium microadriaticum]